MSSALSSKASAGLAIGQRVAGSRRATKPGRRTLVAMNAIELKAPPYPLDALEPHMSKSTFEYHWGKHHKTYVDNLNKQIAGKDWENKELEEIVLASWNNGSPTPEFNNAAQIWNHTFFWESMKPNGGGAPTGALAEAINRDFGSFDEFKNQFKQAGLTQFGSGWAWLNSDKSGKLSISKTPNAVLPVVEGKSPILTCDVWEHAYYIDYQNRRPDFIQTFMDKLINWDMVSQRRVSSAVNGQQPCERQLNKRRATRPAGWKPPAGQVEHRLVRPAWSQQRDQPVRGMMWCPVVAPRKSPQAPRSSQAATQPAASKPGPSTPLPAKRTKRTKAELEAAEPTKGKGKAAQAKPAPQPGRWLDRDCNAALNMQRIGESRWRPLELCYWPEQGKLPAKGKEYPGLGYKRLRDKPPKGQQQQAPPI
ncbi:hypothetical protein QJQ45_005544 [Haematococcus lacustris]|nr:hypothetical protein QJQ45_005544 [Haematococcus lacustris]